MQVAGESSALRRRNVDEQKQVQGGGVGAAGGAGGGGQGASKVERKGEPNEVFWNYPCPAFNSCKSGVASAFNRATTPDPAPADPVTIRLVLCAAVQACGGGADRADRPPSDYVPHAPIHILQARGNQAVQRRLQPDGCGHRVGARGLQAIQPQSFVLHPDPEDRFEEHAQGNAGTQARQGVDIGFGQGLERCFHVASCLCKQDARGSLHHRTTKQLYLPGLQQRKHAIPQHQCVSKHSHIVQPMPSTQQQQQQ
jgi:hypothetical protein